MIFFSQTLKSNVFLIVSMGDIETFEDMLEANNVMEQTKGPCIPSSASVSSLSTIVNELCHGSFNVSNGRSMREVALQCLRNYSLCQCIILNIYSFSQHHNPRRGVFLFKYFFFSPSSLSRTLDMNTFLACEKKGFFFVNGQTKGVHANKVDIRTRQTGRKKDLYF